LLVQSLQFSGSRMALVITAISELARNMILYANCGEIALSQVEYDSRNAVVVTAEDSGPGIVDLQSVLSGGYSTSGGQGLGLSGLRHIVDKFQIKSQPGAGTQVVVTIASA
jgi:serine/threonine-protein kinase RsbT